MKMNHYKANLYFSGTEHEMIINARSKLEAVVILLKLYKNELEKSKIIIKVRDLTFEEKKIYEIKERQKYDK